MSGIIYVQEYNVWMVSHNFQLVNKFYESELEAIEALSQLDPEAAQTLREIAILQQV